MADPAVPQQVREALQRPREPHRHGGEAVGGRLVLALILVNLALPVIVGLLLGRAVDAIGSRPRNWLARSFRWTGIFDPPTAWDAAWLRATDAQWAAVEIRLKDDRQFNVLFDRGSVVGLSPAPRHLFFDTEYRWRGSELDVIEHEGIYIDGAEIESVRFEHVESSQGEVS